MTGRSLVAVAAMPFRVLRFLTGRLIAVALNPITALELVRGGRGRRTHALRVLFVLILSFSLWLAFHHFLGRIARGAGRADLAGRRQQLARFAQTFFFAFLGVQLAAAVLVTPAWLGGAVAEDKDRRRLEALLTTDLRPCEIVLGKLLVGLGRLGMLLLAGVPILALAQFWGGIEPGWLLAGYAVTGVTLLSLGGLTLFCSVHARRPLDAILMTYLVLVAFAVITVLCHNLARASMLGWDWLAWLADGNILILLHRVKDGWERDLSRGSALTLPHVASLLQPALLHYAASHGALALLSATGRACACDVRPGRVLGRPGPAGSTACGFPGRRRRVARPCGRKYSFSRALASAASAGPAWPWC